MKDPAEAAPSQAILRSHYKDEVMTPCCITERLKDNTQTNTHTHTHTTAHLVLVQLTVLVLLLPLLLEGDDDEAHEDVHHEEGDQDDVDDEEDGDGHAVIVDWAGVLQVGINGLVQNPGETIKHMT